MHRYAIFSAHFEPHMGGIEAFTKNLACELVREGDAALVVTTQLGGSPDHEVLDSGVEVVRLPAHLLMGGRLPLSRRDARYRRNLAHVAQWHPDRVLVNARFYEHSVEALKFARAQGVPAVVLDHGSAYLSLSQPAADAALRVHEHLSTARVKRFHPRFAGVSQASAQWLRTFGVVTELVVNNAIDAPAFRALSSGRDFRGQLGIAPQAFVAAFCGRLIPEKHPELLVAAARRLPSVHFVLAGEGPLQEDVAREAAQVPNLHLVGRLSPADVSALFAQSDCLAQPTRSEGFATVMLEAGAWGLSPVIPRVGGVEDAFGGTDLAQIMPRLDAQALTAGVEALARETPEELRRRKQRVRQRIQEHCSWAHTVRQLDRAFSAEAGEKDQA